MQTIIFWYGYYSSAKSMQGLRFYFTFFFLLFTPHPPERLYLREERSMPTYIDSTPAKSRGRQPSPTKQRSGSLSGGGWVDQFQVVLMGLICICLVDGLISSVCWVWSIPFAGFDFCSHGFDSYGFGFTVLIFSADGFARFQEDESWVDRQWVDPFDRLLRLMAWSI